MWWVITKDIFCYINLCYLYLYRHVSDIVSGGNTKSCGTSDIAFWPCIKEQLTWHEQERFSVLKKVHTDYGRGRAWLRAVLNERSLERHLHAILDPSILSSFYEDWAFLLDQERSAVLPDVAAGIITFIQFCIILTYLYKIIKYHFNY